MRIRTMGALCFAVLVMTTACGEKVVDLADDTIYLRTGSGGVAVLQAGAKAPSFRGSAVVPSMDWSTLVRTQPSGNKTRFKAFTPTTGARRWEEVVPGRMSVKLVSHDGTMVAASPISEPHFKRGRRNTSLMIAGSREDEPQMYGLEGNYEPEAFSSDGHSLFMIRYLPPMQPTSYQVRRLDLGTGKIEAVYTPDAHLQRAMGGTARIQAASPDGKRLYTLYTVEGPDGEPHAFIHVLALDELWAHCIDLPHGFGVSAEDATGLAVSPDGTRLLVVNSAAEQVATIDTERLRVTGSKEVDLLAGRRTYAVTASDGRTYVGSSGRVTVLDRSLDVVRRVQFWEGVKGLQVSPNGRHIYVGLKDQVGVIDRDSQAPPELLSAPGIGQIRELGPISRPVVTRSPRYDKFNCAC